MQNESNSKEHFKSFDTLFGICVFGIACYLMLNTQFLSSDSAREVDPVVLTEIRDSYYHKNEDTPTLLVFETSWCGVCKALKRDLIANSQEFIALDIEKDRGAHQLYQKVYGQANGPVPISIVKDKLVIGGRINKILQILEGQSAG